ncbi:branched-chain amino acid ABC transporter permease [Candidatus Sordicultor fermentans]|uniref:branched-chain amino acid ABC transporter permease n=1 Tax=Candidatus Sordicultor fermentans TaxID=1953203 RepID=UPI001698AAEC|nr:branched-chain amino acid ABC transporter permease [Candidatus Atribacteria bacterium]HPZ39476.1 branched-chain amino acid ABC transporter permease [Candidatus Atribacteria bacterium]HQD32905.1 branched-chain amino acid ABC transporter permease [Candidatus Atribacteria bacterium]
MGREEKRDLILTLLLFAVLMLGVSLAERYLNTYLIRILNTACIYVVAAVAYNLINGITGQFSLGPNGFMAIGGYTVAILMLPLVQKEQVYFLQPLIWPFNSFSFPSHLFLLALFLGGVAAALAALLIGIPTLRLRGDYLAIATFGFGEIINVLANNFIPLTNGALGIKGIPEYTNLWWTVNWAFWSVFMIKGLVNSSFGRALKAIRENEVAAEAMGVNLFRHKLLSFVLSGFFAGVAGGLFVTLISTVSPSLFTFTMTFNLLIIIVLGGLGSITGSVVTAFIFAFLQEILREVEAPITIGAWTFPGIPGMRMVVFSVLLVVMMIFYRRGLFGDKEISWQLIIDRIKGRNESEK